MYNLYNKAHSKKDKVASSGDKSRRNALPTISLETVKEDQPVCPSSPRGRSLSEAFASQSHLLHSLARHCSDTVDSKFFGESLPRLHKRSEIRLRSLNTQLLEAIKYKNNFEVQRILAQGANPNATCSSEYVTACHLAALADGDALSLLQARNAQMMRKDRLGRTPLHFAAWGGNLLQIAILLNIPADILNKIKHHVSPDAAEEIKSMNSTFQDLVNVRCELGDPTQEHSDDWLDTIDYNRSRTITNLPLLKPGWTPLHAASANARHECVNLLLAAGSDTNVRDFIGRSALDVAGFAYYGGQQINPNHFAKVIKLLLQANPNHSNINIATALNTPLHTAVEVESIEAITELLATGASVFTINRDGLTPMHLCVNKKLEEHLQVLVNSDDKDLENVTAAIDALDKDGRTVLHTAVLANWTPGVCIALEAGANISVKANDGETPIHLAATLGNLDILSEILNVANIKNSIDCLNSKHETALFKAVVNDHIDCVKILLKHGAYISVTMPNEVNLFHAAASLGLTKTLKYLLDYDDTITGRMINFKANDRGDEKGYGPIHYAVWNNHPDCVHLLLSKKAHVSLKTKHDGSTPLHLVAMKNNLEIAKILFKFDPKTLHSINKYGWTALHTASRYKSREVIIFLLSKGADLGAVTIGPDKFKKTAIYMIMNNLSKPTEFMEEVFDSYIYSNNLNLHDPKCEVTVDYSILHIRSTPLKRHSDDIPSKKIYDIRQTAVIEAIIGTGNRQKQDRLLVHPLIESFLYLKWRALLPFFYMIIVVYSAFVISLTVVILSFFFYNDKDRHIIPMLHPKAWSWFTLATLIILIPQEACYYKFSRRYFRQLETWIKLTTIFLALVLITSCSTGVAPDQVWYRHIATITLLLSWVELMFLLSGFPKWGYYVPMFRKVSANVLKILMTFIFLIIGFSLSFMIEFHAQEPFENPFAALVKTMVMMTSEFDYDDLIKNTGITKGLTPSPLSIRIIFVGFLIFAAIVLMNLMVGVAVNDLQNLELLGNIRRIKKQVHFLAFLENLSNYIRFHRFLPSTILKKLTVKQAITLCPSEQSCEYYSKLPARIRDAIFDIAQAKKQHVDEELGTQCYNKKLDEIHKAIVTRRKEDKDTTTPIARVEKKEDGSDQLASVVAELKNKLDSYFERTQYSIELLHTKTDGINNRLDKVGI